MTHPETYPALQRAAERSREQARQKIRAAREEGGPLLEAIVRGHGCCLVNDPEFDQALWDEALRLARLFPPKDSP